MDDNTLLRFVRTFRFLQDFDCLPAIDAMFHKLLSEDWESESVKTNETLIVCFCRSNFQVRKKLKNYNPFVEKSKAYLLEKDISLSVLAGIL